MPYGGKNDAMIGIMRLSAKRLASCHSAEFEDEDDDEDENEAPRGVTAFTALSAITALTAFGINRTV